LVLSCGGGRGAALAARFSNPALLAVAVTVGSGLVQAKRQLLVLDDLKSTDYGRALVSKVVVFLVLVAIAALTRRLHRRPEGTSALRTRDAIGLEVLFATGVLALTASLVNLPPPRAQTPPLFNASITSSNRIADITIEPATVGVNTIHLTVTNADGSLRNPTALSVRLSLDAKNVPPIKLDPTQFIANHATFENITIAVKGTWALDVVATYGSEQVLFSLPVKIV
jgi:copper transport protein